MNEDKRAADASKRQVSVKNLYLDPNNYRLIHEANYVKVEEGNVKDRIVAQRTFKLLAGDRNENISDLVDSFKANGYLPVDQIQVRELPDGGFVVVEGNRRVAALKHLATEHEDRGADLGVLDPGIFSKVPVVLYEDADELHHLTVMALKHISGNKKWGEWNQAKLLRAMHSEHNLPDDEIRKRIGIKTGELRRSLRALSLVEQYQKSDYGDQFDADRFAIFRDVVRSNAIKDWIGWNEETYQAENASNLELFFSWLSSEPIEEDDDDGQITLGQRSSPPVITKRDDVRILGEIIQDEKALSQLKLTRDLNAAYRSSNQLFRERQEDAVKSVMGEIETLEQMNIEGRHMPDLEGALGRLRSVIDRSRAGGLGGVEQRVVFHDRLAEHFSSIVVGEYKQLRNLRVSKLSRINLIAGLNNCGKTTLLEAIYLLGRQNDFTGLHDVVCRRGKIAEDRLDPDWFIEQMPQRVEVAGVFDQTTTSISITHYPEDGESIDKARYLESVEIASSFGQTRQESLTRIYRGRERETQATGSKVLCPIVLSSPFFLNEPHRYATFYHKSVRSKSLPRILQFIREKVIHTVTDIRLVDERQRFLVEDANFAQALDLTAYGEGLQRVFFICLLFAAASSGVVLIDEFENAIHTEIIPEFTGFLHELSKLFDVQVFLTTHSKECIDAFVLHLPDVNEMAALALVATPEGIVSREFSGAEFKRLVEAGDVDLRRAQ